MKITKLTALDIRYPTSRTLDGSDATHTDPDYSAAYVILHTDTPIEGSATELAAEQSGGSRKCSDEPTSGSSPVGDSFTQNAADVVEQEPQLDPNYPVERHARAKQPTPPHFLEGHGLTFTIGRGNELCVAALHSLSHLIVGKDLDEIKRDMRGFWRSLTNDSQLRWIGPEKGVIHLATAAIVNAVWDLWAKEQKKPLWKLLCDMSPEEIVSCIDFRYITDHITPEEALELLRANQSTKKQREEEMLRVGYPAYTTSAGWLGYPDDKIRRLCREAVEQGFKHIKIKVGRDLQDDIRRCAIIRDEIGDDIHLMMDANQYWDVNEAIAHMKQLARFNPYWIEEPTSPDDVLGHAAIAKALAPIKVATGEHCQNRVIFKQLLQANAIQFCQIDSCRLGGVNENLAVILMAKKSGVPVCPHSGGVGLCEYVQHLALFDYLYVSASLENRVLEYVDHLHEHFVEPVVIRDGHYMPPMQPGYSITIKPESLDAHRFPDGSVWRQS